MDFDSVKVICDAAVMISGYLTNMLKVIIPIVAVSWSAYHVLKFGFSLIRDNKISALDLFESREEEYNHWVSKQEEWMAAGLIEGYFDKDGVLHGETDENGEASVFWSLRDD